MVKTQDECGTLIQPMMWKNDHPHLPPVAPTAPDLPLGRKKRTLLHQSFHWDWLPCLEETHLDFREEAPLFMNWLVVYLPL